MFAVTVVPVVDLSAYIVSAAIVCGEVLAAVVLYWFGFRVVRAGSQWARDFADAAYHKRLDDEYEAERDARSQALYEDLHGGGG